MDNFRFYPTLTDDMTEKSGCSVEKYSFSYTSGEWEYELNQKGRSTIKLTDPSEIWKIENDGLRLEKKISIAYPNFLFGKDGIVCADAELGICIIWTNKTLTQTGCIMPVSDITTPNGRNCYFEYDFEPGRISGDLELSVIMYVKKQADSIHDDEHNLMNEEGVSVGVLETVVLDFNSIYMEFPIEEFSSENEPLWWVEFSEWEDPKTIETFTKENICLYLNPHYHLCPMTDGNIKNVEMLSEILAMTYFMIFNRLKPSLSENGQIRQRKNTPVVTDNLSPILHSYRL